jgi:chromate reductase
VAGMTTPELRVLGICGSLRRRSLNLAALRAAGELMPPGMSLQITSIAGLPLYDQDIFDAGMPAPVARLRAEIAAADGLLIASPEYNFSLTAALKNAIDWASRPPDQPFQDKPIAILSVTPGPLGGARGQYDLRRILGQLWGHVLPRPEVFIGNSASKFDADDRLIDEPTRRIMADQLEAFRRWILRLRHAAG